MVSFRSLLFYASDTLAITTVSQISSNITSLDTAVQALTHPTTLYTGGLLSATPSLTILIAIYLTPLQGITDSAFLPFSISGYDAEPLISLVNTTLAVDDPVAVETLKGKKQRLPVM